MKCGTPEDTGKEQSQHEWGCDGENSNKGAGRKDLTGKGVEGKTEGGKEER